MTQILVLRRVAGVLVLAVALWMGSLAGAVQVAIAAPPAQSEPIYAVPGTLTPATGQPFLTYFVTQGGSQYAISGATPEVEAEITRIRDGAPGTMVKVWGDLYAQGQFYPGPEIVASAVQEAAPSPAATATPTPTPDVPPVAVGRFGFVNLHSEPDSTSPVVGQIVLGQRCPITGRDANSSWLRVNCAGSEGWVTSTVVSLEGDLAEVPVVGVTQVSQIPIIVVGQPTAAPPIDSWRAIYYANRDLQGNPVLVQDAPRIEFDWGTGSPGPTVPAENFSASFERDIDFAPGLYRLCLCNLDDGARLFIDDELVLSDWREAPARDLVVERQLSGRRRVRIEYFEAVNAASISFSYTGSSDRREEWQAAYWNNTTLEGPAVMARTEPRSNTTYALDYDWGTGSPAPGVITADIFSARWEGVFTFEAGTYVFRAVADDGLRMYVNGTLVLYGWQDGYAELQSGIYSIGAGQHRVRVDYYERTGDAISRVSWYRDQPMFVQ